MMWGQRRFSTILLAAIPVLVYIAFASYNLSNPGIYYDEVIQALPAMKAIGFPLNPDFIALPKSMITLGQLKFPLLITGYLGSLESVIFIPVFSIFAPTVISLRMTFIILGILAIILTFIWARQIIGNRGALITSLLMATNATYIFFSRADNGPIDTMMLIKMGMLIAFVRWWKSGSAGWFYAGAFLAGLGIYDKANFLWMIGSGLLAVLVFYRTEFLAKIKGSVKMVALAAALFLLGTLPLFVYVALSRGGPFRAFFVDNGRTAFQINNHDFFSNLLIRVHDFYNALSGYLALRVYTTSFSGKELPLTLFPIPLFAWLFILSVIVSLFLWISKKGIPTDSIKLPASFALISLVILAASAFTPTNFSSHHLMMIFPFPQFLVAVIFLQFWDFLKGANFSRIIGKVVPALIVLVLLTNTIVTVHSYHVLNETGGVGMWSTSIYKLANYLETQNKPVVCMDWGLCNNLQFISRGTIKTTDQWHNYLYPVTDESGLLRLMDTGALFIFHSPTYTGVYTITAENFPLKTFLDTSQRFHRPIQVEKEIEQANGESVYVIYR